MNNEKVPLINSYNVNDYALWAMLIDDLHLRNSVASHWNRPVNDNYRDVVSNGYGGALDLSHQVPAMLKAAFDKPMPIPDTTYPVDELYAPDFLMGDIRGPQGWHALNYNGKYKDIKAGNNGYNEWSHNAHKGGDDADYTDFRENPYTYTKPLTGLALAGAYMGKGGKEKFQEPFPKIWNWFQAIEADGAYITTKE
ncbi:hypothetical protein BVX99_00305 [bacterium F16]|nr:hypothetical protein BVX99_00305 [bacterium F16]